MNQRFQNEDIRCVSERYADNELYKTICTIGSQLEAELPEFGLCSEECFVDTQELLSAIADKGEEILPEIDNLWLSKENEYRRFDRHVNDDVIRKAVGIVFGYVILAVDSSSHPFYRHTLAEQLMTVVAEHKFEGWTSTLDKIFSLPLPDGWFDAYIDEEPEEVDKIELPKDLDTIPARKYFARAIDMKYMNRLDNNKYQWIGTNDKGNKAELAYFLGKVYNYKYTISGNAGDNFPEESLNNLFNVKRLYSSLVQVYNAQKPQRWRSQIDMIFK